MKKWTFPTKVREALLSLEAQKQMLLTGWMAGQNIPEGPYQIAPDLSGLIEKEKPVGEGFAPPRNRKETPYADGPAPNPSAPNAAE